VDDPVRLTRERDKASLEIDFSIEEGGESIALRAEIRTEDPETTVGHLRQMAFAALEAAQNFLKEEGSTSGTPGEESALRGDSGVILKGPGYKEC
jgi:hypothetical protein